MNKIIKTVLHPDNFENKDIYPKTSIDQVEGLEERLNEQKAIEIEQVTLTGKSGTLTEEELTTLQSQEINQILCDNEIFRLMDNQAESGYLVYGHVGVMSNKQNVKTITITISTRAWVLQSSILGESGTQLYLHNFTFVYAGEYTSMFPELVLYASIIAGKEPLSHEILFRMNIICRTYLGKNNNYYYGVVSLQSNEVYASSSDYVGYIEGSVVDSVGDILYVNIPVLQKFTYTEEIVQL